MTPETFIPAKPRRRRKREPIASSPAPVGPLTLVACAYDPGMWVELTFDRAIDIAGIDGEAITIDDGDAAIRFRGTEDVTLTGPATVRIVVTGFDDWFEPGVTMTATGANGIVAVGDGAAWAGVSSVVIPFP